MVYADLQSNDIFLFFLIVKAKTHLKHGYKLKY